MEFHDDNKLMGIFNVTYISFFTAHLLIKN